MLKMAWQLGVWFHRTFTDPSYKSGPFIPPASPLDQSVELHDELQKLKKELQEYQEIHRETAQNLEFVTGKLKEVQTEQAFWEQMALDADREKADLERRLKEQQQLAVDQSSISVRKLVRSANTAASHLHLDEAGTRQLIDQQLRDAGWQADFSRTSLCKRISSRKREKPGHC